MLFLLVCAVDVRYNLKGKKHIIRKITNALNFDTPITYST